MLSFPQLGTMHTFKVKLKSKLPISSLDSLLSAKCPIRNSCFLELFENSLKRVKKINKCLNKLKTQKQHKQVTLSKEKIPTPPKRKRNTTDRPAKKMKVKQLSLSTYLVKL